MKAKDEKPSIAPPPVVVSGEGVEVELQQARCPFCRDQVPAAESVVCQTCLTRHHAACWDEGRVCSSCGGELVLRLQAALAESAPDANALERAGVLRMPKVRRSLGVGLGLLGVSVFAGLFWTLVLDGQQVSVGLALLGLLAFLTLGGGVAALRARQAYRRWAQEEPEPPRDLGHDEPANNLDQVSGALAQQAPELGGAAERLRALRTPTSEPEEPLPVPARGLKA